MPRNVKPYRGHVASVHPLRTKSQLDAMFQPVVQLRSGGYIVLNQTEALVAIDVNSAVRRARTSRTLRSRQYGSRRRDRAATAAAATLRA